MTLILLRNDHFAVQCPPGTESVSQTHIFTGEDPIAFHDYDGAIISAFNPPGSYTIVGLASEITEEQAKRIVDTDDWKDDGFIDYGKCWSMTKELTALESFRSLLTSLSLYKNLLIIKQNK